MSLEWDGVVPHEDDLWKLFSDHADNQSDTIVYFEEIKPLLLQMRLTDETKFYHVYDHGTVPMPPDGAARRATVTQKNLRNVARAIDGRGSATAAAIQYLGRQT